MADASVKVNKFRCADVKELLRYLKDDISKYSEILNKTTHVSQEEVQQLTCDHGEYPCPEKFEKLISILQQLRECTKSHIRDPELRLSPGRQVMTGRGDSDSGYVRSGEIPSIPVQPEDEDGGEGSNNLNVDPLSLDDNNVQSQDFYDIHQTAQTSVKTEAEDCSMSLTSNENNASVDISQVYRAPANPGRIDPRYLHPRYQPNYKK